MKKTTFCLKAFVFKQLCHKQIRKSPKLYSKGKHTQPQQSNVHTMKEQLELHISWEGEGISLKSLSNILKGFDDINDTLSTIRKSEHSSKK